MNWHYYKKYIKIKNMQKLKEKNATDTENKD